MRSAVLLIAFSLLTTCSAPAPEKAESPPNIVVIVADDLGYNDLGSYGSEFIQTPHLDALASGGVRATDGYVSAAVCSPSRAGLYTGRYQPRFGYEYNTSGRDTVVGLPTDERTLADMLGDAGYATGLVGKWHLGKSEQHHPLNRGFDEYFGVLAGGTSYIDSRKEGVQSWPARNAPTTRGDGNAIFDGFEQVEVEEYLTDVFADRAVDFIRRHKDERFFLMLTPNAPHTPLQATTEYTERYADLEPQGRRIFAAMVSSIDDYVGDVVAELRANGLEENTLIVFTSDNGCVKYLSQDVCSNDPLRGSKRFHLPDKPTRAEFGCRSSSTGPLACLPDKPTSSRSSRSISIRPWRRRPRSSSDCARQSLEKGEDERTAMTETAQDSVNLLPYLRGERTRAAARILELAVWRFKPNIAVRWGKWKMWKVTTRRT